MKVRKGIVLILLFLLQINVVFSASVNDDPSVKRIMEVGTKELSSDWYDKINVSTKDNLSFNLHYFSDYGNKAENITFFLENLDGRIFEKGQIENIWGKITSTTVDNKSEAVKVTFNEGVKLNLYNVSWQKWPCQSVGCETPLPQPARNVINGKGLNIGTVDGDNDKHYAGNLVVTFKTFPAPQKTTSTTDNTDTHLSDTERLEQKIDDNTNIIIKLLKMDNIWNSISAIVGIIITILLARFQIKQYKRNNKKDD